MDGARGKRGASFYGQTEDNRMAAQYVSGASPVTFISEDVKTPDAGTLYQIPLPLISYNTALNAGSTPPGPVDLSNWPQSTVIATTDLQLAQGLIQSLINQGLLKLSNTPAP
jgi:hypothetical protein